MMKLPATLTPELHSLIHWLSLSGVSTEITDDSGTWQMTRPEMADLPAKTPQAAPAQRMGVPVSSLPTFPDLTSLNAALKESDIALRKTATQTVLGKGILQPRLMVISDAPETEEDISGQGFTSKGNQMILEALRFAGFETGQMYLTYLSKWRPPGQRSLTQPELAHCSLYLSEELRLVQPQAVLLLGESSFKAVLPSELSYKTSLGKILNIEKQHLNYDLPVLPMQRGEFLVKNPSMKKVFWLNLIHFAEAQKAPGIPAQANMV